MCEVSDFLSNLEFYTTEFPNEYTNMWLCGSVFAIVSSILLQCLYPFIYFVYGHLHDWEAFGNQLSLTCGFWGLNSGHLAWWPVPGLLSNLSGLLFKAGPRNIAEAGPKLLSVPSTGITSVRAHTWFRSLSECMHTHIVRAVVPTFLTAPPVNTYSSSCVVTPNHTIILSLLYN